MAILLRPKKISRQRHINTLGYLWGRGDDKYTCLGVKASESWDGASLQAEFRVILDDTLGKKSLEGLQYGVPVRIGEHNSQRRLVSETDRGHHQANGTLTIQASKTRQL